MALNSIHLFFLSKNLEEQAILCRKNVLILQAKFAERAMKKSVTICRSNQFSV